MENPVTRSRPIPRWRWLPLAALGFALAVGCGEGEPSDRASLDGAGGSAGRDQGPMAAGGGGGFNGEAGDGGREGVPPFVSPDGFTSNPVDLLRADPGRDPFEILATDVSGAGAPTPQDYVDSAVGCYDDTNTCGGPECEAFASCCTASGSCCEPTFDGSLPGELDFESCAGLTVESCAAEGGSFADAFGPEAPALTSRGLVPNGSAIAEGGAWLGGAVNLASERVSIDAQFSLPIGCGGTCLQSAGVAFSKPSAEGSFAGAEVGLLLSGSREDVNLLIGGQVADSFDAGSDATVWTLILSPNGAVEVLRNGVPEGTYAFDPSSLGDARLAVFGRNLGPDSTSAAIARLTVQTARCDNPSDWSGRIPLVVSVGGEPSAELMTAAQPSIASGAQGVTVAFEADGAIFVGEEEAPGAVSLLSLAPAVFPTEAFEAGGLGEPELFSLVDSLYLFYTAYDADGVGSIGAAMVAGAIGTKSLSPVLTPEGGAVSFDSPTVVVRDGLLIMVLRATLSSGATELWAYYSADPLIGWERVIDGGLEELTRVDAPTSEIESPSLVVHNSAYHLYFARRAGTRWAVELAVSDELLIWRSIGEVLGASGSGFDSLGARGPDAVSRTDGIDLVYMGQDGVSFQLGYATRTAPSNTAPMLGE